MAEEFTFEAKALDKRYAGLNDQISFIKKRMENVNQLTNEHDVDVR